MTTVEVRSIWTSRNEEILVDAEDYKWLGQFTWGTVSNGYRRYVRRQYTENDKACHVYMHREILALAPGEVADHINGNTLDNRRANLRKASHAQNMQNSRKQTRGRSARPSAYKGLYWEKDRRKWRVRVRCDGKTRFIGRFKREIEAAKAYDKAALEMHGEFASLNFT